MTKLIVTIEVKEDMGKQLNLLKEKVITMMKSLENDYNNDQKSVVDIVIEEK